MASRPHSCASVAGAWPTAAASILPKSPASTSPVVMMCSCMSARAPPSLPARIISTSALCWRRLSRWISSTSGEKASTGSVR